MRRKMGAVLATAVLATPALAGTYFEGKTTAQGGKGTEVQRATVKAWVDGDRAKVEFVESGNPLLVAGGYLLTRDGGETMFLVNPKDRTYARFELQSMSQVAGGMAKMVNLKVTNPRVEKLEQRPGGLVLGLPTTYYKFRTTYETSMRIMGFSSESATETVQEVWATPELVGKAFGAWLRKTPPSVGDPELDRLIALEAGKVDGWPLKTVTTTTTTEKKKGRTETSTVTMEVTQLQVVPVPESTFEIPAGYRETQLLPLGEGGTEGEENPFTKVFGGRGKG